MTMGKSDSLLGTAAPGFDEPLDMLRACHGRIDAQCRTLEKLLGHLAQFGGDEQARQAAAAVLRYFDTAGRHHHADEEENLFPMLLQTAPADTQALVSGLLAEHDAMERLWEQLRVSLSEIAQGKSAGLSEVDVSDFVARYTKHIDTENTQLLPLAERVLSLEQRERLGRAMAERRGARR